MADTNRVAFLFFLFQPLIVLGRASKRDSVGWMVNRKGKREGTLVYLEALPEDEPAYRDGYSCDTCQREFTAGPLFHCKTSGEDRCLECAVRSRIWHPLPETVREVFFARDETCGFENPQAWMREAASPVAAFRTATNNVLVFLYNGTCLHMTVGVSALISGYLRDGTSGAVMGPMDGLQLVERFPFLELWCDAQQLNESTLFNKTTFGSLESPPPDEVSQKEPLFVTCFSLFRETLTISLSNGIVQALHRDGRGGLWHVSSAPGREDFSRCLPLFRTVPRGPVAGSDETEQAAKLWCEDAFEGLRHHRVGARRLTSLPKH